MATISPRAQALLRQSFRRLNPFMVLIWRLGLGSALNCWPAVGGRIMVLLHTGRTTGLRRQTPVNYALIDGDLFCVAGFGPSTDWYRNIVANPSVEVWLPGGWWAGVAEDVSAVPDRLARIRTVLRSSGIVAPLVGADPHTLTDAALDAATTDYKLVRIRRSEARTGPGGPGDLAWIWPVTALLLAVRLRSRPAVRGMQAAAGSRQR